MTTTAATTTVMKETAISETTDSAPTRNKRSSMEKLTATILRMKEFHHLASEQEKTEKVSEQEKAEEASGQNLAQALDNPPNLKISTGYKMYPFVVVGFSVNTKRVV